MRVRNDFHAKLLSAEFLKIRNYFRPAVINGSTCSGCAHGALPIASGKKTEFAASDCNWPILLTSERAQSFAKNMARNQVDSALPRTKTSSDENRSIENRVGWKPFGLTQFQINKLSDERSFGRNYSDETRFGLKLRWMQTVSGEIRILRFGFLHVCCFQLMLLCFRVLPCNCLSFNFVINWKHLAFNLFWIGCAKK